MISSPFPNPASNRLGSEKAQQILAGAMQVFLARGYAGTSMDRVAAAASVSKATVYSYFQDKESLFNALVQEMARQKFPEILAPEILAPESLDAGAGPGFYQPLIEGDPATLLRDLAKRMVGEIGCDSEHLAFMRLILGESGRFPQLAQIFVEHIPKRGIATLARYLASQPTLTVRDPEATARLFIGTLVYFVILQEMLNGKELIPMNSDRLIDTLLSAILPPQCSPDPATTGSPPTPPPGT